MSPPELVTAFAEGRISRRTLIRRLVASGVSLGAAVSYAHLLHPERAQAKALGDEYNIPLQIAGKILRQDLDTVIDEERVRVRFSVPKKGRVEFHIWLRRPDHKPHEYDLIGEKAIGPIGPVTNKEIYVPLRVNPPHSVDALRPLEAAELELNVVLRRNRGVRRWGSASHSRTLQS